MRRPETPEESLLPLPSATLHILVALSAGEKHGYAIMGVVESLSDGAVRMGPGTLYGSIKRMLADGMIEESAERPDAELDDQRRRYYRLTGFGQRVCAAELQRLEALIHRAGSPEWARRRVPRLREREMASPRSVARHQALYRALLSLHPGRSETPTPSRWPRSSATTCARSGPGLGCEPFPISPAPFPSREER